MAGVSGVNVPEAASTEYCEMVESFRLAIYAYRALAAETVNVAVPVKVAPSIAVIVDVPVAAAKATPVAELIVAVAGVPEVKVTAPDKGWVVPSVHSSKAV